ncbi:SymE family type I addiction module toxin [Gilliamella sp. G0441]|uniref:SymE family type I addiction module toxin n=1 Tax=Gilliamella sp. G0441 TaxID=3384760 RepID=UPI003D32E066
MAKRYSTLKSTTDKALAPQHNERFYTVGYVPQGTKPNSRTQVIIKGRWLEQIGFYVGCPVIIKMEQCKLVVELAMQSIR